MGEHTQQWLENVRAPPVQPPRPSGNSPAINSLKSPRDETGAKVMINPGEENMKFPQSMKLQRAKPESLREGPQTSRQLEIPGPKPVNERRASGGSLRQPSPVPRLITSEEKDSYFLNTDGSSESDSETDNSSRRRSKSLTNGEIITTAGLIALSQALTIHPHSPSSFRSQNSYFEENVPRSMPSRSKQSEHGASNYQGAIPIPNANGNRLGATPRPDPIHLAPDSKGNTIPPDAKWTKINRRLVSPEVLDQAHKRYEA